MRLTSEQIKNIAFGAVNIFEDTQGIHFRKFSERQIDLWFGVRHDLGCRAKDTTGVRVDFFTNSTEIRFKASGGDSFDLYVDGILRKRFDTKAMRESGEQACFSLTDPLGAPLDKARVTLYFPSHSEGVLEYLSLDDGAYAEPYTYHKKFLFLGDSITQGAIAEYDSLSYAHRVSRFFEADSLIQSISGSYFKADAFEPTEHNPDTVIIAYGTNDFAHFQSYEDMEKAASDFFDGVKSAYGKTAKNVFYVSAPWQRDYEKIRAMGSFAESRKRLALVAISKGFVHIDGLTLLPSSTEFLADGFLHPNALGFGIYAENLIKQMIRYM